MQWLTPAYGATPDARVWRSTDLSSRVLAVDMVIFEGDDLKTKTPNLGIFHNGRELMRLTWDDANQLAEALRQVAGIAENG